MSALLSVEGGAGCVGSAEGDVSGVAVVFLRFLMNMKTTTMTTAIIAIIVAINHVSVQNGGVGGVDEGS